MMAALWTWLSWLVLADLSEVDPFVANWTPEKARVYGKLHRRYLGDFGTCFSSCGPVKVVRDHKAIAEREARILRGALRRVG